MKIFNFLKVNVMKSKAFIMLMLSSALVFVPTINNAQGPSVDSHQGDSPQYENQKEILLGKDEHIVKKSSGMVQHAINGTIRDEAGDPLPGVSVKVKDTNI